MSSVQEHTALVLEGGGMRGVFTCGVLDALLDADITFPYVVAVSAGACNGLSYLSRQRGRAKISNIDLLQKLNYFSLKHIFRQHSIMDLETLFDRLPNEYLPFDYDTCFSNPAKAEFVCTDCLSGRAVYLSENADRERLLSIARASSSLPFVCPVAMVDRRPMLDGGIVDSIPFRRAYDSGFSHCVVVSTRNRGFRSHEADVKLPQLVYKRYPRLRVALSRRVKVYNAQLAEMEQLETEGRLTVVRPRLPMQVDRLERNAQRLTALYEEGLREGERFARWWKSLSAASPVDSQP